MINSVIYKALFYKACTKGIWLTPASTTSENENEAVNFDLLKSTNIGP